MFLIYLLLWFLFNSRITLEITLFGLVISAACYGLTCVLFDFSIENDLKMIRKIPGIAKLLCCLLAEIWKANLCVTHMIYSRRPLHPAFTTIEVPLRSTGARVSLADCITLTPGTITGLLDGSRLTVHCLDASLAEGMEDSVFVKQLKTLEEEKQV